MRLLRKPTTEAGTDDDTLVRRCLAGNTESFGVLYDRHLPGLYAYAYRLLGNQADAEDAAHESLTRAWTNLNQYQAGNFRGWLFSILHNNCVDRQRRYRPQVSLDENVHLPGAVSVETEAIDLATIDDIAQMLRHFSASQQAVVAMKMSGLTYREIAAALGKSDAAVAQDYSRAIKRLAEAMERGPAPAATGKGGRS